MNKKKVASYLRLLACLLMLGIAAGCSRSARITSELHDPLVRDAHSRLRDGDKDGALMVLNKALLKNPYLSQAHLDAALLYDGHKRDYVRAIYHYTRYLELSPDTETRTVVEDLVRKAKIAYVASLLDQGLYLDQRIRQLQDENDQLRKSLRVVRSNLARAYAAQPKTPAAPAAAKAAVAPVSEPVQTAVAEKGRQTEEQTDTPSSKVSDNRLYQVQPQDTLSRIAAKVYQNPRQWQVIFEANRDVLTAPEKLTVGQTLKIPEL